MKFDFDNNTGERLSGRLELPKGEVKAYALFAHCFTCSKNVKAASLISKALSEKGIAVLRFDFTGLGNSEGDFANTNFSSNVNDLISAFKAIKEQYATPKILIGHSLGGAAVLKAASLLEDIEAVVTIGSPSSASHVSHLFDENIDKIAKNNRAEVDLFGRKFTITQQFINDINEVEILKNLGELKKALLVMHSPIDNIVSIDEAAKIYNAAKHPKSFISLDDADHLISKKQDSQYVSEIIASWLQRYALQPEESSAGIQVEAGKVLVKSHSGFKFRAGIHTQDHYAVMDEPKNLGGENAGMTPYQLLQAALGGCTSMTMKMYSNHKGFPLEDVEVEVTHKKIKNQDNKKIDHFTKTIRIFGDELTAEQKTRLLEIAEKCPVNKTLKSQAEVESRY